MTPEPMSDAEIEAVREEFISWNGDFFRCESPELAGFVAAIIAARDAQWREMLGSRWRRWSATTTGSANFASIRTAGAKLTRPSTPSRTSHDRQADTTDVLQAMRRHRIQVVWHRCF